MHNIEELIEKELNKPAGLLKVIDILLRQVHNNMFPTDAKGQDFVRRSRATYQALKCVRERVKTIWE